MENGSGAWSGAPGQMCAEMGGPPGPPGTVADRAGTHLAHSGAATGHPGTASDRPGAVSDHAGTRFAERERRSF